eukprot:9519006-Lingulodinium_polyedra.AAC.1
MRSFLALRPASAAGAQGGFAVEAQQRMVLVRYWSVGREAVQGCQCFNLAADGSWAGSRDVVLG